MSYQLVKSNPRMYRLLDALEHYRNYNDLSWTVCKDTKAGDTIFLGQAGNQAGIYAKVITTSKAEPNCEPDAEFYLNPEVDLVRTYMATTRSLEILEPPLLESDLAKTSTLQSLSVWLHCQGKARHLNDKEGEALERLITSNNT